MKNLIIKNIIEAHKHSGYREKRIMEADDMKFTYDKIDNCLDFTSGDRSCSYDISMQMWVN